jgi:hypothetical protein
LKDLIDESCKSRELQFKSLAKHEILETETNRSFRQELDVALGSKENFSVNLEALSSDETRNSSKKLRKKKKKETNLIDEYPE